MNYFFQIFEDHFITCLSKFYLCIQFSSYFSSAYNLMHNMLFNITFREVFYCVEPSLFIINYLIWKFIHLGAPK